MKLTIVAATGGVGRRLLIQALNAGHDVTAVARNPARLPADVVSAGTVRIVTADLAAPDPRVLQTAIDRADAVLSALGPHNNSDAGIAAPGTAYEHNVPDGRSIPRADVAHCMLTVLDQPESTGRVIGIAT
jgi:uncharacterized protein YbjT (DUF2867 family)